MDLKKIIKTVLTTLCEEELLSAAQKLKDCGVEFVDDLLYIEETDLSDVLKPIQCRKLISAWKMNKIGNSFGRRNDTSSSDGMESTDLNHSGIDGSLVIPDSFVATESETTESSDTTASSEKCISKHLPLPPLDDHVSKALKEGKSHAVWDTLVGNISYFYMKYSGRMNNQTDYRQVGEDLYLRYPSIKRNGAKPWTHLMACVSTKLRNDRLRQKRKSQQQMGCPTASKRSTIINIPVGNSVSSLTEDDYNSHCRMISEEVKKTLDKRDTSHLKTLLRGSHTYRRMKIKSGPWNAKCIMADLIQEVPCLKSAEFIWEEFRLTLGKTESEMMEVMDRCDELMEKIEMDIPTTQKEDGDFRVPNLLKIIESRIGFHSGKGAKSKSFIKIHPGGDEVKVKTKSAKGDCPHLHLFASDDDDDDVIDLAIISGDGTTITIPSDFSVTKACLSVLACYYVFDIEYPRVYAMLLGFMQQVILRMPLSSSKKTKGFYKEVARYE